jgi:hypothetical protein
MEILSYDLLSKLLSSKESILKIDKNAHTAGVDLTSNVIIIPEYMVNRNDNMSRFIIAHECSHIIHTPVDKWEKITKESKVLTHIVNVIEDSRIDRLVKLKYPGIRYDYIKGIKYLKDETQFFGKREDYDSIVDKLNYHLKVNYSGESDSNIDLLNSDTKLKSYYDRSINCSTFDQVVKLARELMEKENITNNDIKISNIYGFDSSTGEKLDINDLEITELQIKSNDELQKTKRQTNKDDTIITIPKKVIFKKTKNKDDKITIDKDFVFSMVNKFNILRKQRNIKSRMTNKGDINLDNLYQYKTNENIFDLKTTKRKLKNHGIVFLVDASASMSSNKKIVMNQLSNVIEFCNITKIPYEVYYYDGNSHYSDNKFGVYDSSFIYEGPKSTESKQEQIKKIKNYEPYGSTPSTTALWCMLNLITKFNQKNKVEKTIFVFFTDGADNNKIDKEYMYFPKLGTMYKNLGFFDKNMNALKFKYTANAMLGAIKDYCKTTNIVFYLKNYSSTYFTYNEEYNNSIDLLKIIDLQDMQDKKLFIDDFIRIIA